MCVRDDADVNVVATAGLGSGDHDLAGGGVLGVGHGVVHQTDAAHNLARLLHVLLEVRRIANHKARLQCNKSR